MTATGSKIGKSHPPKTPNPAMLQCISSLVNYKYISIIPSNSNVIDDDLENTTMVNKFHNKYLEKELKKCISKELKENIFKGKWRILSRKKLSMKFCNIL